MTLLALALMCAPARAGDSIPVAVAVNPVTNKTYVVNCVSDTVSVIDGATRTTRTVAVGDCPSALAVNVATNRIYVVNNGTVDSVSVINGVGDTVIGTIALPLGGNPLAIAVDPIANLVYVPNSALDTLSVINGSTNTITTNIPTGDYPITVAVNPVTGKIYVANYFTSNVTIILGTTVVGTLGVGSFPDTLAVNPVTNKIYVPNSNLNNISVIDGVTNLLRTPISLTSSPNSLALDPVTNRVYVTLAFPTYGLTVVDGGTDTIVTTIPFTTYLYTVAVNPLTNQAFVSNSNSTLALVSGATNTVLLTLTLSAAPYALGVNPVTNTVFGVNPYPAGGGDPSVFRTDVDSELLYFTNAPTVPTNVNPRAVAVNPVTNKTYVANADSATVTVVNGATNGAATVAVGANPRGIAVNPLTDKIYVANRNGGTVTVINGPDNTTTTLPVGATPSAIKVNTLTNRIYVTNEASSTVSVINGATNAVIATVPVGATPVALAVNDVTNFIYVANSGAGTVSAINGLTNAVAPITAGAQPLDITVNTETNKIYVANSGANTVTIIDGSTNGASSVAVGTTPSFIGTNRLTNTVYVANVVSQTVSVINGATGAVTNTWSVVPLYGGTPTALTVDPVRNVVYLGTTWYLYQLIGGTTDGGVSTAYGGPYVHTIGAGTGSPPLAQAGVAVNPFTNKAYVTYANGVEAISSQPDPPKKLITSVTPLPGNKAFTATPTLTFTASSSYSPTAPVIRNVFFQMDTWTGQWTKATQSGSAWTAVTSALKPGVHIVYAFAADGLESVSNHIYHGSSPVIGSIASYLFVVGAPPILTSVTPSSGTVAGGTPITIAGSNFGAGALVTVGAGAATSVVVASSTSITAVTPPGLPGAATVAVTNPIGQSGTLGSGFTYTCAYSVTPTSREIPAGIGNDTGVVLTTPSICPWTASADVSWLHPVASGSGSGPIVYAFDANPSLVSRQGHLTVQGLAVTVTQAADTVAPFRPVSGGTKPVLSGNARFLAFASDDATLVPADTNGQSDIFVLDRVTGKTVRVNVSSTGVEAIGGGSGSPVISANGRFVAFESEATNLVSNDTNGVRDVFLRDRDADGNGIFDEPGGVTTTMVSLSIGNAPGSKASASPSISGDGRFVAFASDAENLVFGDANLKRDIFLSDRLGAGTLRLTLVSLRAGGGQADQASDHPVVSGDGRYVAFESDATNLDNLLADTNGQRDVFVRDRTLGTTIRLSLQADGLQSNAPSYGPAISDTGTRVLFTSDAALAAADTNGASDIYSRPVGGGLLVQESVGNSGQQATGGASLGAVTSADGRYVAFTSGASNLSSLDTNLSDDVFVRDRNTGLVRLASVPTSDGVRRRNFDVSLSADGQTLVFSTVALTSSVTADEFAGATTNPAVTLQAPPPSELVMSPSHGQEHTKVTVTGKNVDGGSIRFGGVTGLPYPPTPGALTAEAPAHAPGVVTVSVVVGDHPVDVGPFTYDSAGTPTCSYSATPVPQGLTKVGKNAASIVVAVTTEPTCGWNATTDVEWVKVPSGVSTGQGQFNVAFEENTFAQERTGQIKVNADTAAVTVTQAGSGCSSPQVTVAAALRDVSAAAQSDHGMIITIEPGCSWTATSDKEWLHVSGDKGSAELTYSVTQNPGPGDRIGKVTVLGATPAQNVSMDVRQLAPDAPAQCTNYTVTATGTTVEQSGGSGTISVGALAGCPWTARTAESRDNWILLNGSTSGTGNGAVSFKIDQVNDGGNRLGTVLVAGKSVTILQLGQKAGVPFGLVDEPGNSGPPVSGSIPLTGWALDDKGVSRVEIYRAAVAGETSDIHCRPTEPSLVCKFIGVADIVQGTRPDVQKQYPTMPKSDSAGWGYLLLTNQLPNSGNGTFRLMFIAWDTDAHPTELGVRTVTVDNLHATIPFGTIDTPLQGEIVQGTGYVNFGWALTPLPKTIPKNGSTIGVWIDGVRINSPTYDVARSDIGALFPGLNNAGGPVGFLRFDTTVLADGVHTIAWVLSDDAGAASGIGSRFFRVKNGTGSAVPGTAAAMSGATGTVPVSAVPVQMARGLGDGLARTVGADDGGTRHVVVRALDVLHLTLGEADGRVEGYTLNGGRLEPLPIGSTLDRDTGTFAWQLGPGFVGIYDLLFVRTAGTLRERIPVRVVVEPYEVRAGAPVIVDGPVAHAAVTAPFTIAGSAQSGAARRIRDVVVYAYPANGSAPVAIGQAPVAGVSPDVSAPFGGQFGLAPYSIDVESLAPGAYDLLVVGRSAIAPALDASTWVRGVVVR